MINQQGYVCEVVATYKKRKLRPVNIKDSLQMITEIRRMFPKNSINHYECFGVVFLDNSLNIAGFRILSTGGITQSVVDIRLLLQACLICNATKIVIFHNHPSGTLAISESDIEVTKKIKKAAKVLDISLLDSLIITEKSYSRINI